MVTLPGPAIPGPRTVARRWLAAVLPDLQTGKGLLTPVESWDSDIYATLSYVHTDPDHYTPVRDSKVQIDIWGRPRSAEHPRSVPVDECGAVAQYLQDLTIHFNPLFIDMSGTNYANVHLADAYVNDMADADREKPAGSVVALARARVTICFVYKVL